VVGGEEGVFEWGEDCCILSVVSDIENGGPCDKIAKNGRYDIKANYRVCILVQYPIAG